MLEQLSLHRQQNILYIFNLTSMGSNVNDIVAIVFNHRSTGKQPLSYEGLRAFLQTDRSDSLLILGHVSRRTSTTDLWLQFYVQEQPNELHVHGGNQTGGLNDQGDGPDQGPVFNQGLELQPAANPMYQGL